MIIETKIPQNLIEHPEDEPSRITEPKYIVVGEFLPETCSNFTSIFNKFLSLPQPVVPIHVNSPGGAIVSLMGIRDVLAVSPKPVLTFTTSMAASCGAILLCLGTKGYRYASPNSMILIHEASTETGGKTSDIMNEALYVEKLNDQLLQILADHSNKTKDFYRKLIKKNNNSDLFITPEEALAWGIVDYIGVPKITMTVTPNYEISCLSPNGAPRKRQNVTAKKTKKKPQKEQVPAA